MNRLGEAGLSHLVNSALGISSLEPSISSSVSNGSLPNTINSPEEVLIAKENNSVTTVNKRLDEL